MRYSSREDIRGRTDESDRTPRTWRARRALVRGGRAPQAGAQRRAGQVGEDRHLRYRSAHLQVG